MNSPYELDINITLSNKCLPKNKLHPPCNSCNSSNSSSNSIKCYKPIKKQKIYKKNNSITTNFKRLKIC